MILYYVRRNSARFQLQLGGSNARELRIEGDSRKIGNVNEGIVEGGEDAGNAENELACVDSQISCSFFQLLHLEFCSNIPSPARGPRETFSLAAAGVLVLGAIATVVGG